MPTPFDLLSSEIDPEDPDDLLQNQLNGQQGKTLTGMGGPGVDPAGAAPPMGGSMGGQQQAAMPTVQGPLAALGVKPRVKLKVDADDQPKPRIKLKKKIKPRIKLRVH